MTEKQEQMPSTSGETREVKELFDLKNFPHILDSDEEDFEDFEEVDREKDPEYFLTDEQVNQAFKEMSDTELRSGLNQEFQPKPSTIEEKKDDGTIVIKNLTRQRYL